MTIKIYSTPTCPHCVLVKEYLKQNNIEFEEINIAQDQGAAEKMVKKSGQMGVPVTIVEKDGKEKIILGFDREKIAETILKFK